MSTYIALLGIGWEMENLMVINFKKRTMTVENQNTRVIAPLNPLEGQQYVEPIKDEVMGGWENSYNVSEDYINSTANGELGWQRISST